MTIIFHTFSTTVPNTAPLHLQGSAVNSTTIYLKWQPPLFSDQNGVIRGYLINISVVETGAVLQLTSQTTARNISVLHPYYVNLNGVNGSYHINSSEAGSSFQLTSETTTLYISNLHPFYTYSLTVAAVTIGPGPYAQVPTVQMPEDGMVITLISIYASAIITYP